MTTMTHDQPRIAAGVAFALTSAGLFGLSGPLGRGLLDAGWSAAAAVALRVLVGAVVLVPVAVLQLRGRWSLLRRNGLTITAYGLVAVAGAQLSFFNAVDHMQVGVALLIEYVAPVAVVGWLWLRHGQRPGRLTVLGGLLALGGLVLVLELLSGVQVSPIGVAWALGAMASLAVYFVLSSSVGNGLPGTVLATGGLVVGGTVLLLAGAVGILPMAASTRPVHFETFSTPWWAPVLALGVLTAALAYVTGIAATRRLGSRLASFVALTEVLVALLVAWWLLGELPRGGQVLGAVLVVAGVVVVKLGEPRTDTVGPETTPVTAAAGPVST
jgi:drug/metabolite transporter (DMT)-like permease